MLLSLTKILLFILIVVFIAAGLAYLLDSKDVILGMYRQQFLVLNTL